MGKNKNYTDDEISEFRRQKRAGKNRLSTVVAKEPPLPEYTVPAIPGPDLYSEDIRVLAVVVEEEEKLDPLLGRHQKGVSRTAIRMICGYDRNEQVKHRLGKLEERALVKMDYAEDLPELPQSGHPPGYALPTTRGKRMIVENLELLPILKRERNTELVLAELNDKLSDIQKELELTTGRVMMLAAILSEQTTLEIDLSNEQELREYASEVLDDWDDEPDIFEPQTLFERILAEEDQQTQSILLDHWMYDSDTKHNNEDEW